MSKKKMAAQVARKVFHTAHAVMNHVTYRDDISDKALCEICDRLEPAIEQANLLHIALTGNPIPDPDEEPTPTQVTTLPSNVQVLPSLEAALAALGGGDDPDASHMDMDCQCDECVAARMQTPKNRMN